MYLHFKTAEYETIDHLPEEMDIATHQFWKAAILEIAQDPQARNFIKELMQRKYGQRRIQRPVKKSTCLICFQDVDQAKLFDHLADKHQKELDQAREHHTQKVVAQRGK